MSDSSNLDCMYGSRDCEAAVSKPRSCVPVALAGYEKWGTLQRHDLVSDSMNNPDVNWWWVDLVDIGRLFCFQSLYPSH